MNNEFDNKMNETQYEDMRQQLNTLKKKLGAQEIINDHLIRRTMRNQVNSISRRYYLVMALCILMIPYTYWCFIKLCNLTIPFWIGTSIFMLICGIATFINNRKISDPGMMNHNLVEARRKVASAKKFEVDWLKFGIPAVIVWLGWFVYELYQHNSSEMTEGILWGGCIGAIIGTILGIKVHMRTQQKYQDIIDQIEDLTDDDK